MKRIKENTKKLLALIIILTLIFSFAACGKSKDELTTEDPGMLGYDVAVYNNVQEAGGSISKAKSYDGEPAAYASKNESSTTGSLNIAYTGNRKIVRNADLSLSTEKYSETIKAIETAVKNVSGYIESSNEDKYSEYTNLYLTVRVPSDKLDEFLTAIDGTATVTSKSITSDDITNSYADTESHLAALKTEQETLLSLLEKANSLSEILEIEDRLTDVRSNIEYYQSMMNTYNDELSYSTVTMNIYEVSHEVETGDSFWANIVAGLKESLFDIGTGFKNFFTWIVINIPYFIIIAIVLIAAYVIIKKIMKKHRAKKAKEVIDAGQTDNRAVSGQE